jgi:hypothetical protein
MDLLQMARSMLRNGRPEVNKGLAGMSVSASI